MTPKTSTCTLLSALALLALARPAAANDWDPDSRADNYAHGWGRLDADRIGLTAWLGTTVPLGHVNLAGNLIATQAYPGVVDPMQGRAFSAAVGDGYRAPTVRLELGPALELGPLFLLPKLGLGYDFERKKVAPFVPQVLAILQGGPLYVESWLQWYLYRPFDKGSQDSFYTRDCLLYAIDNHVAVGLQTEVTVATTPDSRKNLRSLPVGLAANYAPLEALTFGAFVGVETQKSAWNAPHDLLAGRLTVSLLW